MKKLFTLCASLFLIVPLLFFGCGSDGDTGPPGPPGPPGPGPGPGPTPAAGLETCGVCHSRVAEIHPALDNAFVSTVSSPFTATITFNVKLNGVNNDTFTLRRAYVNYDNTALPLDNTHLTRFVRKQIDNSFPDNVTLVSNGGGNYTATVPAGIQFDNAVYLLQLTSAATIARPIVVAVRGTSQLRDIASDEGCVSCHGPSNTMFIGAFGRFQHYSIGGSKCQICHSQATRQTAFISKDAAGNFVSSDNVFGTNITEYVHGIHNSHHMPDGVYYRTTEPDDTAGPEDRYSVGYPSDMRNCKVCHKTPTQLAAVAAAPVSYYLCMTCHNNWDGFVNEAGNPIFPVGSPLAFHRAYVVSTNCMQTGGCHGSLPAANEAADFHDLFSTESHTNSFYRGTDISFDNPDNVQYRIGSITKSGDNVTFTWTASKGGAAVDPCNTDNAAGPTFRNVVAYLAYAKGDDWVNEFVGTSPGQPAGSRNVFTSLSTTCSANVATTTGLQVDPDANAYASKAALALAGKPVNRGTFTVGATSTSQDYLIRVRAQLQSFSMATGAVVAARRTAVLTDKCLACHQGTLYQHGGDRVDEEQICVICHNPSSSDKNNRKENTGGRFAVVNPDNTVNTSATYDGKVAETYDLRHMLHSIHGVEKAAELFVIYRTRGIFAFVPPDLANSPPAGWPLVNGEVVPVVDNAPVFGSTNNGRITHNWIVVHYPRYPFECLACHVGPEAFNPPDQSKAVALTVDPGNSYVDQSDDIVIGPTAAACTACHATPVTAQHATSPPNGYRGNFLKEDLILLATP